MTDIFEKYARGLQGALDSLESASQFGANLADQDIRSVFFIGCGAPQRVMSSVKYWVDRYSTSLETHLYYPAEFIAQPPVKIDAHSLVFLISETGKTAEVVEAAQFIRQHYPCHTVSISARSDTPLSKAAEYQLSYSQGKVGFEAKFMLLLAILSSYLQKKGEWHLHTSIMEGLKALPSALASAEALSKPYNDHLANLYRDEGFFMITASGPCYPVAYSLGVCILMEALWVKLFEGEAAEFFHGPFEIIDQTVPVILLIGEDPSRPIAERVLRFLREHTQKILLFDAIDHEMKGIPQDVRPIFAPYILGAASYGLAEALSILRGQPLSTRRYMGKTSY